MKEQLKNIWWLIGGLVIGFCIYSMFIVSNLIATTNSNTTNINQIASFINQQIEASKATQTKPADQVQSIK